MDKWITSLLTCVFRQNSPAACRVGPAKSVFGRHSPAGWPASHRRLFANFLFRRPERFPRGPSTDKTPDLPIFSCADVNPSRAADACPPTRKTAGKRLARRRENVLRQNRRRGRRAAAWAKGKIGRCRLDKARRFGKRGRTCLEKRRIFRQMHRFASICASKALAALQGRSRLCIPAVSLPYSKPDTEAQKAPRVKGRRFLCSHRKRCPKYSKYINYISKGKNILTITLNKIIIKSRDSIIFARGALV